MTTSLRTQALFGVAQRGGRFPAAAVFSLMVGAVVAIAASIFDIPAAPAPAIPVTVDHAQGSAAGNTISVRVSLSATKTERVRVWYYLGKPGDLTPWLDFSYRSEVQEFVLTGGRTTVVRWREVVKEPVAAYQPTVWVHRLEGGQWVHVAGGEYGLPLVHITNGASRFAERFGHAEVSVDQLSVGSGTEQLKLTLTGASSIAAPGLVLTWELRRPEDPPDRAPIYMGRPQDLRVDGGAFSAVIDDVPAVPPGSYDIVLTFRGTAAARDPAAEPLQVVSYPRGFVKQAATLLRRSRQPTGASRWSEAPAQPILAAGATTPLPLGIEPPESATPGTCVVYWRLLLPDGSLAAGGSSDCAHPSILLPSLSPGAFSLELNAWSIDPPTHAALLSDSATVEVLVR